MSIFFCPDNFNLKYRKFTFPLLKCTNLFVWVRIVWLCLQSFGQFFSIAAVNTEKKFTNFRIYRFAWCDLNTLRRDYNSGLKHRLLCSCSCSWCGPLSILQLSNWCKSVFFSHFLSLYLINKTIILRMSLSKSCQSFTLSLSLYLSGHGNFFFF